MTEQAFTCRSQKYMCNQLSEWKEMSLKCMSQSSVPFGNKLTYLTATNILVQLNRILNCSYQYQLYNWWGSETGGCVQPLRSCIDQTISHATRLQSCLAEKTRYSEDGNWQYQARHCIFPQTWQKLQSPICQLRTEHVSPGRECSV